ncbi:protein FAM171B-like [Polyodon spathula]|uniref:protein FAM171B-like n=1 Tax=Polyodon spathula TaxID=7913 RepID=UPI001B7F3889|nr:protein FAM171B-like [Polyodon spathula]XP_041097522.1 protein FAM171B-like [Polyodon spathula]
MDPAHHSTLLVVILVTVLLLLLGVAALLLNYCRGKCLQKTRRSAVQRMVSFRDQATSTPSLQAVLSLLSTGSPTAEPRSRAGSRQEEWTSVTLTSRNQDVCPGDPSSRTTTRLPLHDWTPEQQPSLVSGVRRIADSPIGDLTLTPYLAVPAQPRSDRLSSSMKSNSSPETLPAPVESPVLGSSHSLRASSLHRQPSWKTSTRDSPLNRNPSAEDVERGTVRGDRSSLLELLEGTLSRPRPRSCSGQLQEEEEEEEEEEEGGSKVPLERSLLERAKAGCQLFQPRAWFISWGKTPQAEAVQQTNAGSLDSGVDVLENRHRREGRQAGVAGAPRRVCPGGVSTDEGDHRAPLSGSGKEEVEVVISPREAVVTFGMPQFGNKRSLWQKWEDRPLIAIN